MSNADDEVSPSDRILMKALAEALGASQPPVDLIARCEGLVTWIDVDSELATLLDQPATEQVGTRGATSLDTTMVFTVDDGSCVIELTPSDNSLQGQVLGPQVAEILVRTASDTVHSISVDETGNFSIDDPPTGAIRLELELFSESRRIHTDWFVV